MTSSNWREMFEQGRGGNGRGVDRNMGGAVPPATRDGFAPTHAPAPSRDEPDDDGAPALDLSVYRPWTLQRGHGRPSMLLDLRRYEPKSGLWIGWQMAYPHLIAVEYIGDKMLSLDFGTRQFMIEGHGLDELARHLQQGSVVNVVEYSEKIWPQIGITVKITAISKIKPA
jgi:hypothetical protein